MTGFFITATGTDAGKTLLTAGLVYQLVRQGQAVQAIKPVVSGVDAQNWQRSDPAQLLAAMGLVASQEATDALSPWRFERPVFPHLAAVVDMPAMLTFCRDALAKDGVTLIEGAGGVLAPITRQHTMLDVMRELKIPAVIVGGSYVGGISHMLSALHVLSHANVPVQAVVINESPGSATTVAETVEAITDHSPLAAPVFTLPRISNTTTPWKELPPITKVLSL
mgnify:CR=1 FL=1